MVFFLGACTSAAPIAPGALIFGAFGDTPYTDAEAARLDSVIEEMNRERLAFVVHVGDIGTAAKACTDAWLLERKAQFARIRHPLVLVPGDNEWTDCSDPIGRLAVWRKNFCYRETVPTLTRQDGPYCEHVRWEAGGWVFVALNVPGSNNNVLRPSEHARRMKAVMAWLDEAAALAEKRKGLVVLMQADLFVITPRDGYADLREKLERLGRRNPGRVMLIHGDTHVARDDEPFPGVRRIEVWGSPLVAWTRVVLQK